MNIEKNDSLPKRGFFDYFTEVIGWIQIVFSLLLFSVIAGLFIYASNPTTTVLIVAIAVTTLGVIAGIIFATRIWGRNGTINFLSGVSATPELDNSANEE